MEPGTIFATDVTTDDPDGVNLAGSGELIRWVAVRGGIHDWAIYADLAHASESYIKAHGTKVHSENNIKKLVPCDDEAFNMYRH